MSPDGKKEKDTKINFTNDYWIRNNFTDYEPYQTEDQFLRNQNQIALVKQIPKEKRFRRHFYFKKLFFSNFSSNKKLTHNSIFLGSFFSFIFILLLIFIPISGFISISYPFSHNEPIQNSGQQLMGPINNTIYESEYLWKGNTIDFSASSNSSVIIAILNSSLSQMTQSTNRTTGSFSTSVSISKYVQKNSTFFLFKGDILHLQISVQYPSTSITSGSNSLDLFISNQSSYFRSISLNNGLNNISFIAPTTDFWQFSYFNDFSGSQSKLQFNVSYNYNASSFNFSKDKPLFIAQTTNTNKSFQVNKNGVYTIVIFTKNQKSNTSTLVNYNVIFHSGIDSVDSWTEIDPVLNIIAFILFSILLLSIIIRVFYMNDKDPTKKELFQTQRKKTNYSQGADVSSSQRNSCPKCGTENELSDKFCVSCGTELKRN